MGDFGQSTEGLATPAKKTTQYITALAATMGAMSFGAILGFSSPAGPQFVPEFNNNTNSSIIPFNMTNGIEITPDQNGWFGSILNIGALIGAPIGGIFMKYFGRRGAMLSLVVPFVAGWLLTGLANGYAMLMVGRVISGLCCGITCVVVPTYIGEFASAEVRGTLGTGFQLMVTVGILYAYVIGAFINWRWLSLASIVLPIIFFVGIFFSKESPIYLLEKGNEDQAKATLQYFRGKKYNVEPEMNIMRATIEEKKRNKASFSDMKAPYIMKPLIISLSLMFFQQFCGINAVLFNLNNIFLATGSDISPDISSIIIGVVQVLVTLLASVLMDIAGRKILLILSSSIMMISLVGLGVFFYLKERVVSESIDNLGWLPLTCLIVYIAAFSIGFGPIPWVMMGELFSANIKEVAGSVATLVNWTFAFVVTVIFLPLQTGLGNDGVYWMFACVCGVALVFSVFMVPETKGKTLNEITAHFGGPVSSDKNKL